jgi:carbon storage regulator
MLVLTRKIGEQIVIQLEDQTVLVQVLSVARDRVRLGITAPKSVAVHREEIARRIQAAQYDEPALVGAGDNCP